MQYEERKLMNDERNHHGTLENLNCNDSFVNPPWLLIFYEIYGALFLALLGLTKGRLADKTNVNFETF